MHAVCGVQTDTVLQISLISTTHHIDNMKVLACLVVLVLSMFAYSQGLKCYVGNSLTDCSAALGLNLDKCLYTKIGDEEVQSCSNQALCDTAKLIPNGKYKCCSTDGCNSASALQMTSAIIIPVLTMLFILK